MSDIDISPDEIREPEIPEGSDGKQFVMSACKSDDHVIVFSEIGGLSRRIVQLDVSEVLEARRADDGDVTAIKARLPHGCLKIKGSERKNANWSDIISYTTLDS